VGRRRGIPKKRWGAEHYGRLWRCRTKVPVGRFYTFGSEGRSERRRKRRREEEKQQQEELRRTRTK